MQFIEFLDEYNKNNKTRLFLDEVSFFKIENELNIKLLSKDDVDLDDIKTYFNNVLDNYGVNIEITIFTLKEIFDYFSQVFPSLKYEYNDPKFKIYLLHMNQKQFYEGKDIFIRFKEKVSKLDIEVEFLENSIDNKEAIEKIAKKKEQEILSQIKKAKEKEDKKQEKEAVKKASEKGYMFSYGFTKSAPANFTELEDLVNDTNKVKVKGKVYDLESRAVKSGCFVKFSLDNGYYAISCKIFVRSDKIDDFLENLKNGLDVIISGIYAYDEWEKSSILNVTSIEQTILPVRQDLSQEKRIEFNIHTKYTNSESVVEISSLFKTLKTWGHQNVGVSDLFNVQAYPEIYKVAKSSGIKLNLGLQTNFIDSEMTILRNYYNLPIDNKDYVVFDLETTGLSNFTDKIIEFGAVKIRNGEIIEVFEEFVNPKEPLSDFTTELTGITNDMVVNADTIDIVLPKFLEFTKDTILVAHNAEFDVEFILAKTSEMNLEFKPIYADTMYISRALNPDFKNHKLDTLTKHYQVNLLNHHRASDDARATAEVFIKMLKKLDELGVKFDNNINKMDVEYNVAQHKEYQGLLYVQNKVGLKNLYIIVSKSNLEYYHRDPSIPLNVLEELREGILIGTGNYKSRLFNLISLNYDEDILINEAKFFNFISLIPLDFSYHLIKRGYIRSEEHLKQINTKLIDIAEKLNIPAVAMGDVYYIDKKDYPFRNVLKNYPRKRSQDNSGAFYLKNTQEMLNEFSYLGDEKAYDVVVKNSYKLNDMIENISPIADGTFPPNVEKAVERLQTESFEKARSIYGDNLPELVESRLNRELNSIIGNGYASLYVIAQELVRESNRQGYLVGSRGSVGSSFAATMADITEVNPLPAHYICENCKHVEFNEDDKYSCGVDLPDKICPKCGSEMRKEGFDIPFEVFLGFEGDKEPDIDLNFASVYQSKIHKYTEKFFGPGKVFRAGTLGTIAEKTAYGMARKYKEFYPDDEKIQLDNANINRVKRYITGVKRTTGQHAGGLIIVPDNKDIEDFTPVQYPADKKETGIITTHFDYHAIDKNLLKLDLLGHNAPTIIRLLSDKSGVNAVEVPLDDKDTMSIFSSTEKLNIKHEYTNIKDGSLGIPEFGTNFVRGMLADTRPTTFEELIRISGLSHGTDVWLGNAQELIRQGICNLRSAICTRDDIMNYLIEKGLDKKLSFDIMEKVRKGKGVSDEQIVDMKKCNVPDWYIESCQKIQYMFPKAHAVAYVMMSFRIAYFKVHHPAYFYAVYFTNAISDFKYTHISRGLDYMTSFITSLKSEGDLDINNEFYCYELAEEMYARDIKMEKVDLYKSHPVEFEVIDDNTILPPLMAMENISESMALRIAEARDNGEFISKEDFIKRTKINKTAIETLENADIFYGMQDTNQIDFFSF
ncbi:PolC-type DNA polymerase III [Helcococcus bovis]|uniref:PolC-type DNA polymerase III n=1 Tax=Helcococcus bovis TaxID=3153252 RepID=UPI0038BAC259